MLEAILQKAGKTEPGFARRRVTWVISCTSDGRFTGVVPLEDNQQLFDCSPTLSQPELIGGRSAEPRANFLIESLQTVALFWKDDVVPQKQQKFRAKHNYFCELLEKAARHATYFHAAAAMLRNDGALQKICQELKSRKARPEETATILIEDVNPLKRDDWHGWWREFRLTLKCGETEGQTTDDDDKTITRMRDFATGELIKPAVTHRTKIKGLARVGGLGTGDVLIGFDKQAFQSYGLRQSCNAAMAEETATAYAETLNGLIEDKGRILGNILVTHWFTQSISEDDDPLAKLDEPLEQVQAVAERQSSELLQAIQEGKRPDLGQNRYVALSLSGQSGRVMVREVMEGSFETLLKAVDSWFRDLSIVSPDGKQLCTRQRFLAVASSLGQLVERKTGKCHRELDAQASHWTQSLWHAAITGGVILPAVAARAVRCVREDINQPASHDRMGLMKAFHVKQGATADPIEVTVTDRMGLMKAFHVRQGDRNMQPYLNPDHPDPAYHCGRALAVFAQLQRAALGDVDSGVVQRYYTAMSQAPALFLGRLTANAQNHLNHPKLKEGLAHWYNKQIACVKSRIGDKAPRTLTMEEQSLFALGYYQQLAKFFAGKSGDDTTASVTQDTIESSQS